MENKISFKNQKGTILRGFVHEPKKYNTALIFCHGFPSSAIGESATRVGKTFEKLGYLTLRFSFSGTPPSDGKFEEKLMSQESREIKFAIDFLTKHYAFKKLVLFGHSTGAIDLALYAHKDKRITKVILGGAVSRLDEAVHYDFSDKDVRSFWKKGYITYDKPGKWVHKKRLKRTFYDEFFTLNVLNAIKKLRRSLLIIHGEKDELIPVNKDPHEVYEAANRPKKLVIIKGADHSFSGKKHWNQVVKGIKTFVEKTT